MMTNEELQSKVRQLINENDNSDAVTLLSEDIRSLDEHISALIPDAVLYIQKNKVWGNVNPKRLIVTPEIITHCDDGIGTIELPTDFVSLITLDMSEWQRPCTLLYPSTSAMAVAQCNPHTRAGFCKPVCVEGVSSDGKRLLHYYSLPTGATPVVNNFLYEACYNSQDGLAGDDDALHNAVAYQCAAFLFGIFERGDNAAYFSRIAASFCNGNVEPNKNK